MFLLLFTNLIFDRGFRSNLARKYRTKLGDLELNKTEVDTLSKEFETKLRAKEAGFSLLIDHIGLLYLCIVLI